VHRPGQRSARRTQWDHRQPTGGPRQLSLYIGGPHRHPRLHPGAPVRGRCGEVPAQAGLPYTVASGAQPQPRAPRERARRRCGINRGASGALQGRRLQRGHSAALPGRGCWRWALRPGASWKGPRAHQPLAGLRRPLPRQSPPRAPPHLLGPAVLYPRPLVFLLRRRGVGRRFFEDVQLCPLWALVLCQRP
jgi:hypothetical protein